MKKYIILMLCLGIFFISNNLFSSKTKEGFDNDIYDENGKKITTPGCYVNFKSDCKDHPSFKKNKWFIPGWGVTHGPPPKNREKCEGWLRTYFNEYCGIDDTETRWIISPWIMGDKGSNECPPNYTRISSEDKCTEAATVLGLENPIAQQNNDRNHPKGCYLDTEYKRINFSYVPIDGVGRANDNDKIICGLSPTTSPPTTRPLMTTTTPPTTSIVEWKMGDNGSNQCPPNYKKISSAKDCYKAVKAVDETRSKVNLVDQDNMPKGCYIPSEGMFPNMTQAYYNTNEIGKENSLYRPICVFSKDKESNTIPPTTIPPTTMPPTTIPSTTMPPTTMPPTTMPPTTMPSRPLNTTHRHTPTHSPSDNCFDILPDGELYNGTWTETLKQTFDKLSQISQDDFIEYVSNQIDVDKYNDPVTNKFDYGEYSKDFIMRTTAENIEECRKIANKNNYNSFKFGSSYKHCFVHYIHPFHLKLLKQKLKPITNPTDWVHGIINTKNKLSDISDICRNYVNNTQSHITGMSLQKLKPHNDLNIYRNTKGNWIYKL